MKEWHSFADFVVKHAKIFTVALTIEEIKAGKRDFPIIEDGAVAAKDGKLIFVGQTAEVEKFIGAGTEVLDAKGKMLVPGFIESHMHAIFTGQGLRNLDFRNVKTKAEMLAMIKERADSLPDGEWFQGNSWNQLTWDVQEMPTRKELDEVSPNNPVFNMRTCFHVAAVNSAALKAAGITRDTKDPYGGTIGHDEHGEPDGLLYENSAMDLVQHVIPPFTDEQMVENVELVGKYLNSMGITSAIDANLGYRQMRSYGQALKSGRLTYRANPMYYLDSANGDAEYHLRRLDEALTVTGFGNDMLKLNAVKVTLDGIPATFTATMREPYKLNPESTGSSVWTQEEITKFVVKAHELGWQFGIHTIGDKAEDMALNAIEAANEVSPVWDRRHYLIHFVLPHEDQFERMRRLNVAAAMQPTIVSEMGEKPCLFDDQYAHNQSAGWLLKSGIIVGGSSDSPVVSPDVIKGMYYAVTRKDMVYGGTAGTELDMVTPTEALIMYTKNSAFFSHDDDKMGSIEVGNFADMVLLDRDFIAGEPEDIINTKVETTILGGKVVYQA